MVGLPNRAGRCKICLRRKIKCDLLRPSCSRCQRMGFSCEYFNQHQNQVFINRSVTNPFVKAADVFSKGEKRALPETSEKTCRREATPPCVRNHESVQVISRIPESPSADSENRMQLLSAFVWVYLPEVAQGPTKSGLTPASWVHTLPDLTLTNSAYNKSLAALCVAQLGAWNHNPVLVKESLRLYGAALVELRKTISSNKKLLAPEATLASVVILSTYEVFSGSSESDNGWASHVRGASRVLQILGSTVRESPVGRQLSARIRTIVIFEAFRTRKASILARLNWQRRASKPRIPDPYRDVQDIMIQIPPIMESLDNLAINKNISAERAILTHLLQTCSSLDDRLLAWYEDLRKQVQGPLYWSLPLIARSPADDPVLGPIFPAAFHFPRLSITQLLLLYWSTQILLYRTIQDIRRKMRSYASKLNVMKESTSLAISSDGDEYCPNHAWPSNDSIAVLAKNICQSSEYCYGSKSGTLGPQSTVFPLWVAQDFYASQSDRRRELAWCAEIGNMTAPDSRFDLHVGSRWT